MARSICVCAPRRAGGFSVIELGLVLLVVGLLIGAIVVPLASRFEMRRFEDTARILELAQDRLLGFASKYGYLPCPALEDTNGDEPAAANHITGFCPDYFGYFPAAALGWSPVDAQGFALDAWGSAANRIRYAVASDAVGGVTNAFTRINGVANAGASPVGAASFLRICGSGSGVNAGVDCGSAPTLAGNAAAVVWSVGPNASTGGTNIHEAQNPNPQGGSKDKIFVSRTREGGTGPEFDDVLRWIAAPTVVAKLTAAGMMTPTSSGSGGTGGGGGTYGTAYDND
ncbi:MAG TPA: hypothetical protein VED01_04760 [Burkholderiales bacterium]|nr:hypothetical protein [Burkholderiales bacterium]